jgi:hypothetical protein
MRINPYFTRKSLRTCRQNARPAKRAGREQGSAALVVIAIVAIVLVYVASNLRTLDHLNREIKLVERRQIHRLEHVRITTNSVAQAVEPAATGPGATQSF